MLHTLLLSLAVASRITLLRPSVEPDSVRPDVDVRLVALRHAGEIQRCYESEGLRVNPGLGGMIEVEVTVSPSGRVDDASVSSSNLSGAGHQEVETCITSSVRNWRFEKGPYAIETIVFPFNLVRDHAVMSNTRT
jgi:TonB family protein